MSLRIIFFLVFLVSIRISNAQILVNEYFHFIPSAVNKTDISGFAFLQNPANHLETENMNILLAVSPSKFGMPELSPATGAFSWNIDNGMAAGANIFSIGNSLFSEYSITGDFAYAVTSEFKAGVSLQYSGLSVKNFGSESLLSVNMGATASLTENITAGAAFMNISGAHFTGGEKTAVRQAVIGAGIETDPGLNFDIDGIVRLNGTSGAALAASYQYEEILKFRLAYLTAPGGVEAGANFKPFNFMSIFLIFNHHEYLGLSQTGGINVKL
mgnify:CR=1 FL=1